VEKFIELIEQTDYNIYTGENAELYNNYFLDEGITAVVALNPEGSAIAFYVFSSSEEAHAELEKTQSNLTSLVEDVFDLRIENSGDNYDTFRASHSGVYYVLSRIDNTLIAVTTEDKNKNAVDELLKTLGYIYKE